MNSAAKLIDYFVHDILDYTILKSHSESFTREIKRFDIRDAIQEIDEVLQDKYQSKEISVKTKFLDFENCYVIETDQKRL